MTWLLQDEPLLSLREAAVSGLLMDQFGFGSCGRLRGRFLKSVMILELYIVRYDIYGV